MSMLKISPSLKSAINALDRDAIVTLLEGYGFACYNSESTRTLRTAVKVNVEDGTIDPDHIQDDNPAPRQKYR